MKILLITGGISPERKISLLSAKSVKEGLQKKGHTVTVFDLKKGRDKLKVLVGEFDILFPVIHGEEGEGGQLQEFLTTLNKPFVGGSPKGFKQGWYKIPFKKFCQKNKITTSPWRIVKKLDDIKKFGFPSVLKSSNGGSSKEVVIIKSVEDLKKTSCQDLLHSGLELFIEQYLPGVEVTVGILENKALPIIEIVPPNGKWFDYKNKYSGATKEIVGAPSLKEKLKKEIQQVAQDIHRKLHLGLYSRIDFIVSDGMPFCLEVNTIPGFTSQSLFPKAAAAIGLPFPELVDRMVKSAYDYKIPKTK